MRAVRIARSVGRPSRLKKPPGIFPAAYMRSSTSTVSGKKSAPSRGSIRPIAVASSLVSPERTITAPSACLASLPVSKLISWSPTVVETLLVPSSVATAICVSSVLLRRKVEVCVSPCAGLTQTSTRRGFPLAPEAELLDQRAVGLEVLALEVVQEPAAPAHELEQAAARVVILRVSAQMLRELVDARCQQRDLHLRRPGVRVVLAVLADDVELCFLGEGHVPPMKERLRSPRAPRRKDASGRGCGLRQGSSEAVFTRSRAGAFSHDARPQLAALESPAWTLMATAPSPKSSALGWPATRALS